MKKILFIIIVATINITETYAQKIKGDFLNVERVIQPKYAAEGTFLDIAIKRTTTNPYFLSNYNLGYDLYSDYYTSNPKFNNNFGTPKYLAIIDYVYNDPTINVVKKDNGMFLTSIHSNISAKLYLIDREKGVFEIEDLVFKDINLKYPIDNTKGESLSYDRMTKTTMVFDNLSEYEANQYKNSSLNYAKQVNIQQLSKLPALATEIIEKKFFPYSKKIGIYFNYIKSTDDFKGEAFNQAYNLIQKSIYPVNNENLFEAISILKTEKENLVNTEDKKILKYKIAILQNIINCFHAMQKIDQSKPYIDELLLLDSKDDIANSLLQRASNPIIQKEQTPEQLVYKTIPDAFLKNELKRFLYKKNNEINYIPQVLGKENATYYLLLNNYINCSAELLKTNNSVEIDNNLMNYLAETLILSKKALKKMDNNADAILINFKLFLDKVELDLKPIEKLKKHYNYFDLSNDLYRSQVRKIMFEKYKRSDFIYTDEIKLSLSKCFEKLNENDKKTVSTIHDLYSELIISSVNKTFTNKSKIFEKIDSIKNSFATKYKNGFPEEYFELDIISQKVNSDKGFPGQELYNLEILLSNIYSVFLL